MFGYTSKVLDGFKVGIYEVNFLSSLIGLLDDCNDGNTKCSLLGESLVSDDGSAIYSSCAFFDVTKVGRFVG